MLYCEIAFGIVAPVHHHFELRLRRLGGFRLLALRAQKCGLRHRAQRRDGAARHRRIGGVGLDQDLRIVAALDAAGEVGRDRHHERDGAVRHQRFCFRRRLHDMVEAVVAGHLQRRDHGARVVVVAGRDQCGGKALRIVVDGVAEQHELHQRHAEHHGEGDAVAPHLDEFLHQERAEPGEGEDRVHAMLSFDAAMNWMKTSSRLVSPGLTVTPSRPLMSSSAFSRSALSEPTTCSVVPKGAT